jgi:hypothetical protein
MKRGKILFWTPRIFTIFFALFLSLFALDLFSEELGFWETTVALLIHLTPVYIILFALAIAWRWELIGAIIFTSIAIFYIIWTWGKFAWTAYAVISAPLFLIGFFFLLNWIYFRKH